MRNIVERKLDEVLHEQVIRERIPFLGICLGMQLLAAKGSEIEETAGLGWINGEVKHLESDDSHVRIPHVGWSEVVFAKASPLTEGIESGKDLYFSHSYRLSCAHEEDVLARTPYCGSFVSAVARDNIFGVQFHPEKSQRLGLQIIRNFLML